MLVHQLLDGIDLPEIKRQGVREHREVCEPCCSFHNNMLQVTAVAPELLLPREFCLADPAALSRHIQLALEDTAPALIPENGGESKPRLFLLTDDDVEEIFGRCMVRLPEGRVAKTPPVVLPVQTPARSAEPPVEHEKTGDATAEEEGWIYDYDDTPAATVVVNAPESSPPLPGTDIGAHPPHIRHGGRQVGRLDNSKVDAQEPEMPGNITGLARFLFTKEEIDSFRKVVSTPRSTQAVQVVLASDHHALIRLHDYLAVTPAVIGSMILSADGTVISQRYDSNPGADNDTIAVWSLASYHNARAACQAFGYTEVQQLVSRSVNGYTILAQIQGLLVAIFVDGPEADMLSVLDKICKIS
jgi:predicted regulator of Ras-like GTPase activity (Roadblock/LC7/MglB family)